MAPNPLKNPSPVPFSREDAIEFCAAGKAGDIPLLTKMLDKFGTAIINERDNGGDTAMTWAAWMGHRDTVKFLLDRGAAVDAPGMHGKTALIWAAQGGRTETVSLLLEKGANVAARDDRGEDALTLCDRNGQVPVATIIRQWIQRQNELAEQKKREEDARLVTAARLQELKSKAPKLKIAPRPPGT